MKVWFLFWNREKLIRITNFCYFFFAKEFKFSSISRWGQREIYSFLDFFLIGLIWFEVQYLMYLNVQVELKWDIITFLKKINISFLKSSTKSVYFLAIVEMKKSKINLINLISLIVLVLKKIWKKLISNIKRIKSNFASSLWSIFYQDENRIIFLKH